MKRLDKIQLNNIKYFIQEPTFEVFKGWLSDSLEELKDQLIYEKTDVQFVQGKASQLSELLNDLETIERAPIK